MTKFQQLEYELIAAAQRGDTAAFEKLVELFDPRLRFNLLRRFLGLISRADLDDILQETWFKVFKTLDKYNPDIASPWVWVNMRGHYAALTFLERNGKEKHFDLDALANAKAIQIEQNIPVNPIDNPSPSLLIEEVLESMTPTYAGLIRDYYYGGFTIEELSIKYGLAEKTIPSKLSLARREMRIALREHLDDLLKSPGDR